jgi:hypothetical protein
VGDITAEMGRWEMPLDAGFMHLGPRRGRAGDWQPWPVSYVRSLGAQIGTRYAVRHGNDCNSSRITSYSILHRGPQ